MTDATHELFDPATLTALQQRFVLTLRDRDTLTLPAVKHQAMAAIDDALLTRFAR